MVVIDRIVKYVTRVAYACTYIRRRDRSQRTHHSPGGVHQYSLCTPPHLTQFLRYTRVFHGNSILIGWSVVMNIHRERLRPHHCRYWYSASQMHLCGLIIERPDNHYKITERPVNLIVIIPFQLIISCTCKMPPHWDSIKCNFCSGPNSRGAEISRVFCVKAAAVPLKTISTSGRQMSNIACVLSCK